MRIERQHKCGGGSKESIKWVEASECSGIDDEKSRADISLQFALFPDFKITSSRNFPILSITIKPDSKNHVYDIIRIRFKRRSIGVY